MIFLPAQTGSLYTGGDELKREFGSMTKESYYG